MLLNLPPEALADAIVDGGQNALQFLIANAGSEIEKNYWQARKTYLMAAIQWIKFRMELVHMELFKQGERPVVNATPDQLLETSQLEATDVSVEYQYEEETSNEVAVLLSFVEKCFFPISFEWHAYDNLLLALVKSGISCEKFQEATFCVLKDFWKNSVK